MTVRRILLLITDLELGGTPTVVRELSIRLRRSSPIAQIEVACLGKWGPVADQLRDAGVPVTSLSARGSYDFLVLPRLVHLLKEKKFDTVFSFLLHANALAAVASLWVHDVRWIQSIQTTQPNPRWHWMLGRLIHRVADTIVVPSPSVAAAASFWSNIPPEKIAIIPNAIDSEEYKDCQYTTPQTNRRPYPIGFLGRLDPVKDVPTLIEAVAHLHGLVHLHIFGEGPDRGRIEQEIDSRDLGKQVILHGAVGRPQQALRDSGLLVLPSLAEGFGLVLIEAMAAGIPVVATDVPGIRDVIKNNQTGLLVPARDPIALAAAIKKLIDDVPLRQLLIRNAQADVEQRFSWKTALGEYMSLLRLDWWGGAQKTTTEDPTYTDSIWYNRDGPAVRNYD